MLIGETLDKHLLLYDGDCGVCSHSVAWARKIDRHNQFDFQPAQAFTDDVLTSVGLNQAECNRQLQIVTTKKRIHSGAFALNFFLWQQLRWKPFVAILYLIPVFLLAEVIGYAIFARNRSRISRWLGLTACAIRPANAAKS